MAEHVSLARMMALFDCSANAIADWTNKGLAIRVKRGVYDLDASVPRIVAHLREAAAGRPSVKEDLTAAKTRLTKAQADGKELENSVREGRLAEVAVFETRWTDEMVKLRACLLSLPGSIGMALPHLTPHELTTIDRCLRDIMTRIAGGED